MARSAAIRDAFERLPQSVLSTPLGKRIFNRLEASHRDEQRSREQRAIRRQRAVSEVQQQQ